jgi:hypothetical protein
MDKKITIFDILADIDRKELDFYDKLPLEVQKAEHPLVLMKWMACTSDPLKIILLNEVVNPFVFSLYKHKSLVMKLLTICGNGNVTRYNWIKQKKTTSVKLPALTNIIKQIYNYNTKQAIEVIPLIDNNTFLTFADELGYQKEEISLVKKDLRKRKK